MLWISFLGAIVFIALSFTTIYRQTKQRERLEVERDALVTEVQAWQKAYQDAQRLGEFRSDVLRKIAVLIKRRPPRRRWLAISKKVATIAAEAWEATGWQTEQRAHWLAALAREIGA